MDNQKATYPSKVRLSEFFFTIVAMAIECIDKKLQIFPLMILNTES